MTAIEKRETVLPIRVKKRTGLVKAIIPKSVISFIRCTELINSRHKGNNMIPEILVVITT